MRRPIAGNARSTSYPSTGEPLVVIVSRRWRSSGTAVNLINQTPTDIVAHEPKGLEEGAAGSDDTQVLIKNHKWVADRIDDGLRKREPVPDIDERCGFRRKRGEYANLLPYS